uniref:CCHC-type domain-containing protein n=1 Tax=Oreochromis niloticus TaxID=8128 RepID=A0A669BVF0_ORENI
MKFAPGSTKYLGHWRKKYGFEGKLVVGQCQMLVEQLTVKAVCAKGKLKQERELQLASAKLWLEQAQKRQEAVNAKRAAFSEAAAFLADEIFSQGQFRREKNRGGGERSRRSWGPKEKRDKRFDKCYACGEKGHHARECPDRMPEEYKRPDARNPYYNK